MVYRLFALDKHPGVRPIRIGKMLSQAISKLVMRAAGDQANMACGSLQLFSVIEACIEGATHTVVKRRQDKTASVLKGRAEEQSED